MFISSYTTIYFFVNKFFFLKFIFSEYDIRMFLFVFWLRNRPSIKCVHNWGNGGGRAEGVIQNVYRCVQGEKGVTPHLLYTLTLSLSMFLSHDVLFYL